MNENIKNEDVLDYQGLLPGASIKLAHLCTASDERPCHIIDQIPACNKLLSVIATQLEEKTPDKLSLVSWGSFSVESATHAERREACALIFWILKSHRCLNDVELAIYETSRESHQHQKLIVECLRTAPSLRRLTIYVKDGSSHPAVQALPCIYYLGFLETLRLTLISCPEVAPLFCPLLETSTSLTTLKLKLNNGTVSYGPELWGALGTCKGLNALHVHFWGGIGPAKQECFPFFEYLKKTSTLSNVGVAFDYLLPSPWLKCVLEALNGKSLVDVILEYFIVDTEEAIMSEKFLRDNIGIRTFELKNCCWRSGTIYFPAYKKADLETVTPRIISWLSILQANSALEKLRFTFHCFSPAECAVFLEELARNRHLKNVYIEDLQEYCCCLNSRRPHSNSEEKGDLLQGRRPEILLIECKPIRRIHLNLWTSEDLDWFVTVVLPLQFSHRVTDFTLILSLLDPTLEAALAIAEFIEESKTLAQLVMDLGCPKNDRNELKVSAIQKTILGGVHRNSTIKDFVLCYTDCTDVEAEELAHTIRQNKTVCYLNFNLGLNAGHVFLSHLFPRICSNYTVLRCAMVGIPYLVESAYHNLSNVAARNQRLVARAAKFTLGSSTKPCAEAFELVSSNPGLVDELCELVSVEETEASRLIHQRLRWLQNLNSFMQVSGVVKRRVACHMNISGWLHLDDVDEYSWRCVRNYLRLADIQK